MAWSSGKSARDVRDHGSAERRGPAFVGVEANPLTHWIQVADRERQRLPSRML